METNFASATLKNPVIVREVEAQYGEDGEQQKKNLYAASFMCSDSHLNGAVEDAQAA